MFHKPISRLGVLKFLGLFGASQAPSIGEDKSIVNNNTDIPRKCNTKQPADSNGLSNYDRAIEASSIKVINLLLEKGVPGLTICVTKKGQTVWHSAFGFCDVENQLHCRPEAHMRIASISKLMFASTVVAPLIDDKKLDVKSSIYEYISEQEFPKPKFANKERDITIEQLLCHRSGIRNYNEYSDDNLGKPLRSIGSLKSDKVYQDDDQYNREHFFQRETFRNVFDALKPIKGAPLLHEPGTKYYYSTYAYTLLSAVIEKVYQRDEKQRNGNKKELTQIEDFWMRTLRRDWKLEETYLDQDEPIVPNRSRYYLRTGLNGRLINAPYTDNSIKWAGGGILSTTRDLTKLGMGLIDSYKGRSGAPLKRETLDLMWKEIGENYALGFQIHKLEPNGRGDLIGVNHSGGALGASSHLMIYPESEVVVAILVNMGDVGLRQLALFVADQFADAE